MNKENCETAFNYLLEFYSPEEVYQEINRIQFDKVEQQNLLVFMNQFNLVKQKQKLALLYLVSQKEDCGWILNLIKNQFDNEFNWKPFCY